MKSLSRLPEVPCAQEWIFRSLKENEERKHTDLNLFWKLRFQEQVENIVQAFKGTGFE